MRAIHTHKVNKLTKLISNAACITALILSQFEGGAEIARKRESVRLILGSMSANLDDESARVLGCQTLSWLASLEEDFFKEEIERADGIRLIVLAMNKSPDNKKMHEQAVSALRLAAEKHVPNQNKCRESGAIDPILQTAERFKDDRSMLSAVRQCIHAMARDHEANTEYVMRTISTSIAKKMHDTSLSMNMPVNNPAAQMRIMLASMTKAMEWENDIIVRIVQERKNKGMTEVCIRCGKTAATMGVKELQRCSACTIAPVYCSVECQRACWGAHKAECVANRK